MKRCIALFLSVLLLAATALPVGAAKDSATAATMRLESSSGTVTVKNASGRSVTTRDGMRLHDGYTISTGKSSYAYISLDSSKALKLDVSSKVEIHKSGKKLEVTLQSGQIFFDVSLPLSKTESLSIRTSTMVTGVRGTAGWISVQPSSTQVNLLEGSLIVTNLSSTGASLPRATIHGGQRVTMDFAAPSSAPRISSFTGSQVPGFVATAVAENPNLQQRIADESPSLNVTEIMQDAQARLQKEQTAAQQLLQQIQQLLNQGTLIKLYNYDGIVDNSVIVYSIRSDTQTKDPLIYNFGGIENCGTMYLYGQVANDILIDYDQGKEYTSYLSNMDSGTIYVYGALAIQTSLTNSGTLINHGSASICGETPYAANGTMTNHGFVYNYHSIENNGELISSGVIYNYKTFDQSSNATLGSNSGTTFKFYNCNADTSVFTIIPEDDNLYCSVADDTSGELLYWGAQMSYATANDTTMTPCNWLSYCTGTSGTVKLFASSDFASDVNFQNLYITDADTSLISLTLDLNGLCVTADPEWSIQVPDSVMVTATGTSASSLSNVCLRQGQLVVDTCKIINLVNNGGTVKVINNGSTRTSFP